MKKQILAIMVASLFTVVAAAQANEAVAVVSPVLRGGASEDEWIAQFVQDSLTQNLVRYTKMRVIDRANESLIMAEQKRSESALYDDADAIELGRMTSARLVLLCTIQKIGVSWELSLRVNDLETNEIKAVASGRFSSTELESASAVNTVTAELFQAWGINLTAEQKAELSKTNSEETRSVKSLAKGAAAEKAGDTVSALAFYAQTNGAQKAEAETNSARLLDGTIPTGSIAQKAKYYQEQIAKWNKIFADTKLFIESKLPIFVYDFSEMKDEINMHTDTVDITVSRGIAFVMRREAFVVYKEVWATWDAIRNKEENKVWVGDVKTQYLGSIDSERYGIDIALLDDDGNVIKMIRKTKEPHLILGGPYATKLKSQQKYFEDAVFQPIKFESIKLSDMPENLHIKVMKVFSYSVSDHKKLFGKELEYTIVSADEWEEFSKGL